MIKFLNHSIGLLAKYSMYSGIKEGGGIQRAYFVQYIRNATPLMKGVTQHTHSLKVKGFLLVTDADQAEIDDVVHSSTKQRTKCTTQFKSICPLTLSQE